MPFKAPECGSRRRLQKLTHPAAAKSQPQTVEATDCARLIASGDSTVWRVTVANSTRRVIGRRHCFDALCRLRPPLKI